MKASTRPDPAVAPTVNGPKYQAEELLALRNYATTSSLCLEKLMEEETLRHLILKSNGSGGSHMGKHDTSRSGHSTGSGFSLSGSSRTIPTGQGNGSLKDQPIAVGGKKPSPSPSIKRGKAERLLKEHGSPPGMRVTAGGRIVPTEFTPLSTPHLYGPRGKIGFARDIADPAIGNGFVGYDHKGQLCQKIGGVLMPIKHVDGVPQLYAPAINSFPSGSQPVDVSQSQSASSAAVFSGLPLAPIPLIPGYPVLGGMGPFGNMMLDGGMSADAQIQFLESEYARLDKERQEFERFEVLKKESLPPTGREELVNRKRRYVLDLDHLRKAIKNIKSLQTSGMASGVQYQSGVNSNQFGPQVGQVMAPFSMYPQTTMGMFGSAPRFYSSQGYAPSGADAGLIPYPPPFPVLPGDCSSVPSPVMNSTLENKPVSAPRRSHAIEITDPANKLKSRKGLDPTSPDYIPGKPVVSSASTTAPDGGNATATAPAVGTEKVGSSVANERVKPKASNSSVTTSAFFPVNTHEHSGKPAVVEDEFDQSKAKESPTGKSTATEKVWSSSQELANCNEGTSTSSAMATGSTGMSHVDDSVNAWKESCTPAQTQSTGRDRTLPSTKSSFSCDAASHAAKSSLSPFESAPPSTESFLDGYCDGLARKAPSTLDKSGDYLSGYCQGLYRSQKQGANEHQWSSEDSKMKPLAPSSSSLNSDSRGQLSLSSAFNVGESEAIQLDEMMSSNWSAANAVQEPRHSIQLPFDSQRALQNASSQTLASSLSTRRPAVSSKPVRQYPGNTRYGAQPFTAARPSVSVGPVYNQRGWPSGCDGVMDDISESQPMSIGENLGSADSESTQNKSFASRTMNDLTSAPGSPKKTSPAKTRLEQFAHRVRRKEQSEDKPASSMTPEDRRKKWKLRFDKIRKQDNQEIREYQEKNPLPPS